MASSPPPIPPLRMKSMSLIFTSALVLLLSSSLGEPTNPNYLACKEPTNFSCGKTNYNISFPFWVKERDNRCSYPPGFLLSCRDDDFLTINIGSIADPDKYQVKNIDYNNRVLTVVDLDDLVGASCPASFSNTTLNLALFELADADSNLTVYMNCPVDVLSWLSAYQSIFHQISCHTEQNMYYSVNPSEPAVVAAISGKCDVAVIPMNRTALDSLEAKHLEFAEAVENGFGVTWSVGKDWCPGCVKSGGACGYNSDAPSDLTCFCPNSNSTNGSCPKEKKTKTKLITAVVCVGAAVFITASLLCFFCFRLQISISNSLINSTILFRSNTEKGRRIESFLEKYGSISPKRYTYLEVKKITKSFSEMLGKGGYGVVYKGSLIDGHPVAVKVLDATKTDDGEDFINEIASIGRTSHVNVVSLLGFCYERSKRALVYDFMPNGSLDRFIYPERSDATITPLGWENLFNIVVGIARGLEYLHRGCNTRIVHFDIKPHNILLDQDLCPKISDFGLAKLCRPKESVISMCGARGTAGYIAPEVFSRNFGVVSSKSDVYSYGMMVLEMVGGREKKKSAVAGDGSESEVYFPHWIYKHLDLDGGELRGWCGVTSETEGVARKMILVGLWCIQTRPDDRPSISRVLDMLEGSIGGLEMPPEPYLSSPVRTPISSLSLSLLLKNSQ